VKQAERRQQTMQLLLECTKALMKEKGCQAITMQDIMARTGLSKGAIFHYVNSKDELFAWVLQERLEQTHQRFTDEVAKGEGNFEGPMQQLTATLPQLEDPQDVTNQALVYLLSKPDQPAIAAVLQQYYERSVQLSQEWIAIGQQHGVIPSEIDTAKTAEMFVLLSLGLRMRSFIPVSRAAFDAESFAAWMSHTLQPEQLKKERET